MDAIKDQVDGAVRSLRELFARAGVRPIGGTLPDIGFTTLTDDSRRVTHGSCFVAVRGTGRDGHDFAAAVARAGASVVVVERDVPVPAGVERVVVADSREALAKLASAYFGVARPTGDALRLVGITGTNGKSTVAWLLRSVLRAAGMPAALLGTIEYDLLTERLAAPLTTPGPLDLCRHLAAARRRGAVAAVLEASSHALDQRRCDGLSFAVGVFTNLTGEHLDYHQTMPQYAAAKRRLFDLLKPDGRAVINTDDPTGRTFAAELGTRALTFALDDGSARVRATVGDMNSRGSRFAIHGLSNGLRVQLALVGRHNISNALAAAAAAEALGVPGDAVREGIETVDFVPGRLQRAEPDGWPFSVLVDYAHTDAALTSVLEAVRPITPGRVLCVFGCGGDRDRTKRPRMATAAGRLADRVFVTSDNPRTEDPRRIIDEILGGFPASGGTRVLVDPDRRRAIEAAIAEARPGDTVLIAGKGHENYQLVGREVLPFDDMAVARDCLSARSAPGARA